MTQIQKRPRPLFLFYLLVVYVFIQFSWWSYLMVKLNNEVLEQRLHIIELQTSDAAEIETAQNELHAKLKKRWLMIAGEGTVFLVLLISGFLQTRKTFKKEAELGLRQKNFLLSITHELKSPIASAKLQLETLLKRDLPKEKQNEIIHNALVDTERLNALVENVLIAVRLEDNSFRLVKQVSNFSELVESEMNKLATLFQQQKPHRIELTIEKGIEFEADRFAFISILTNLYENAIKYSTDVPKITCILKKYEHKILLQIADEGCGIDETERQLIFDKFYRIGNEETRKNKGTGLGLYIVKKLVLAHHGTIEVKKNSPKGSIFEIVLIT
jgi:two-component system phosphate regulon sensor histidine kinase PhoR